MSTVRIFADQSVARARERACAWAAERVTDVPHSVRYLAAPAVDDDTLTAAWESHGSPLALGVTHFDGFVNDVYEADTHRGPATYVTMAEREYTIERALTRLSDPGHPLFTDGEPATGLVDQAANLLTLLEFAGLDTPDRVRTRLQEVGVPSLADPLATLLRHTYDIRDETLGTERTFRAERYLHAVRGGEATLSRTFPTTDVLVVGARQTLSPLERDLLEVCAATFDIAVVLPRVTDTAPPRGADSTLSRAVDWYAALDDAPADELGAVETSSGASAVAARLYRSDTGHEVELARPATLQYRTYPSIGAEVAAVVRDVRSLLTGGATGAPAVTADGEPTDGAATGLDPADICIAVSDEDTYTRPLGAQLRAAGIPVSYTSSHQFFTTTTGDLLDAAIELGQHPDRQEPLCELLANPLVRPASDDDLTTITGTAERLEATRVDRLRSRLEASLRAHVDTTVEACEAFVNSDRPGAVLGTLFDALGVPVDDRLELTDDALANDRLHRREARAVREAVRAGDSIGGVTGQHTVTALRRLLERRTVDVKVGRESDSVRLVTPMEAVANPFEVVFLPGLTTDHTPSRTRRLAFARRLNDAHDEFAEVDPVQQARHSFALLLAGPATLRLSRPETNANGDPYVPADLVTELDRVTTAGTDDRSGAPVPATRTGVHRSLADAIDTGETGARDAPVHEFDIECEGAHAHRRLDRGLAVAAARATDDPGRFDGHLDRGIAAELGAGEGPFSPTALERYATCGFRYYMQDVLDIEERDEVAIELDPREQGGYVHSVLETFYRTWQERGREGITERTLDDAAGVLHETATAELETLDTPGTAFHRRYVSSLFDGLTDDPAGPGDPDAPPGLFRRFLETEAGLAATPARPVALEGHVGLDPGESDTPVLSETPVGVPGTTVTLHGRVDRLDATPDGELVAYDYKTGGTPSEGDTLDGYAFQLPVYLLLAESALDGDPVGGSYYRVDPGESVSVHSGTIGASDDAAYYRGRSEKLLRRHHGLEFDSRGEFQTFLHEEIPDRIDQISAAVEAGSFQPTVLSAGDAGCDHCPYRAACDVRHHRRHDIRAGLEEEDSPPAYVPVGETPEENR